MATMASRLQIFRPFFNRIQLRQFITSTSQFEKPLPPRIVIPDTDLDESFLKGSGPGGQKINKTSSAVQLKHIPTGIVVKSQETRSRQQNRKIARRILSDKLENLEKGEESRQALKAKEASRKKASKMKKSRRKYRKLEEMKNEKAHLEVGKQEGIMGQTKERDAERNEGGDVGLPEKGP